MAQTLKALLEAATASAPAISKDEALALMQRGAALVVDVRDAPEIAASGKVKGARHVSRGMLEFRADPESPYHDPAFDKGRPVIVYCASGGRSKLACKTLRDLGYADVRNLGAFKDWVEAGGETEPG